ncbi:helix-turn-helix domain-containing protein [Mycobacterium riyadhense]|uniref:helix-turn-helix domain-containing protein n=1 Tax=Mycobacterium riyadhense TaxID=486698 RepID=UPI00195BBDBB|nr:helix-turn-helix domain-containing protein [Mycobacterium riyadhense]
MSTGDLLTFAEAAQRLGVHTDDIRRWVRTEQCPVIHVGRKRRIPAAWVADPQGWTR